MLTAKEIMTKDVITVKPDTTVQELAGILTSNNISGTPVVDDDGHIVGIVTEHDLIKKEKRLHIPTVVQIFDSFIYLESSKKFEEDLKKMVAGTVGGIMTEEVITVGEDATLSEIATVMSEKDVHLLPVMSGDKLVGVVGKKDIVRAMTLG
jgi:CBS domain-containing protein